jgi:hypothetical protein
MTFSSASLIDEYGPNFPSLLDWNPIPTSKFSEPVMMSNLVRPPRRW